MEPVKVPTSALVPGMYVSELDRPWTDTPFMFQGFLIQKAQQISQLQKYCAFVYVDADKGRSPSGDSAPEGGAGAAERPKLPLPEPAARYQDQVPVEEELDNAKQVQAAITSAVGGLLERVKTGAAAEIGSVKRALLLMEESILRNPDAFMLLRRLKSKDSYTYGHCIDVSMLAMAFGRQLGLSRDQIQSLGLGALLADVGKMKIPKSLLTKSGVLTDDEFATLQRHVHFSVQTIKGIPGVPEDALSIAATHHERLDGSGYPRGLQGAKIPLFGRMVAIVDTFDAMTSERPYARACSAQEVVRKLYEWRTTAFQEELVEEFIQLLGVYPVGSVVELSTGEVGIIIGQNRVRRLRPKVMLVLDERKQPLEITPVRDLMLETTTGDGRAIQISRTLEPGEYGLDPADYYL